jgi:hypothetical protein
MLGYASLTQPTELNITATSVKFSTPAKNETIHIVCLSYRVSITGISFDSLMIPKVSRCTVDILSQILSDKTQDVGKQS